MCRTDACIHRRHLQVLPHCGNFILLHTVLIVTYICSRRTQQINSSKLEVRKSTQITVRSDSRGLHSKGEESRGKIVVKERITWKTQHCRPLTGNGIVFCPFVVGTDCLVFISSCQASFNCVQYILSNVAIACPFYIDFPVLKHFYKILLERANLQLSRTPSIPRWGPKYLWFSVNIIF